MGLLIMCHRLYLCCYPQLEWVTDFAPFTAPTMNCRSAEAEASRLKGLAEDLSAREKAIASAQEELAKGSTVLAASQAELAAGRKQLLQDQHALEAERSKVEARRREAEAAAAAAAEKVRGIKENCQNRDNNVRHRAAR